MVRLYFCCFISAGRQKFWVYLGTVWRFYRVGKAGSELKVNDLKMHGSSARLQICQNCRVKQPTMYIIFT